jgi:flagellar protein FlgJ
MDINNKFAETRNFLDVNGLNSVKLDAKTGNAEEKQAALKEAAQQFEAIFTKMLLKTMRQAQDVLASDSPMNSESTKFYRDMHDQQLAVELSGNGSLGLSDLIIRQLGGADDTFTPQSIIRQDGNLPGLNENGTHSARSFIPSGRISPDEKLAALNEHKEQARQAQQLKNTQQTSVPFAVDDTPVVAFEQPKDFVTALIEPAKRIEKALGIPFEVVIAQSALETGWGQKIISGEQGQSSNNLFNIKADSRWSGNKMNKDTLEYEQGTLTKVNAPFRAYETLAESANDYINFISSNDRYKPALEKVGNVEQFLQGLQQAGYATDPKYADKIMSTLRRVSSLLNSD